jgi:myosin heavy subunit
VDISFIVPFSGTPTDDLPDLVRLADLNEPSILHNLRSRYRRDCVYVLSLLFPFSLSAYLTISVLKTQTYVGPILISINPYKNLPIFSSEQIAAYKGKLLGALPPHIFAIAETSYRSVLRDKKNHSILISGESGAGKTEATKYIMKYLTSVTGEEGRIEKQLLSAHPILEGSSFSTFFFFFSFFFSSSPQDLEMLELCKTTTPVVL